MSFVTAVRSDGLPAAGRTAQSSRTTNAAASESRHPGTAQQERRQRSVPRLGRCAASTVIAVSARACAYAGEGVSGTIAMAARIASAATRSHGSPPSACAPSATTAMPADRAGNTSSAVRAEAARPLRSRSPPMTRRRAGGSRVQRAAAFARRTRDELGDVDHRRARAAAGLRDRHRPLLFTGCARRWRLDDEHVARFEISTALQLDR